MKRIGLLSDTHSDLDASVFTYFAECDEVWHAGDIGSLQVTERLEAFKLLRAVHGNIDDTAIRLRYPEDLRFTCEGLDVWITHIGGYPGRYSQRVANLLKTNPPQLFICGHSHILRIMPDKKHNLLHMNPGACGNHGFHLMKTLIRFSIDAGKIDQVEVIELGKRGAL